MKYSKTLLIVLINTLLLANSASAGDIDKGKVKAQTCIGCHGVKGISPMPNYPNLAGQKEQYLKLQLDAYRNGSRKHMLMTGVSAMLSDEDIANLAAYYASLPPGG